MIFHLSLAFLLALVPPSCAEVNYLAAMPLLERRAHHNPLLPRQTGTAISGISQECLVAAESVLGSLPSPPPEVQSAILKDPQTNPCDFTTPSSLTSEFSSYSSVLASWASSNENKLTACSALSSLGALTDCKTANEASATSTRSGNLAAARPTGVAVAACAVAAAGFAAAAAL
ncbi:hypothetical protein XA68_17263 [Ophiocordyceps unilateralis]|uniref:Infection structure specific protein n=1 Tax=Ophiocordyceps unilateralis TaxID=268505 RepID=A0A2A9PPI8_OPHUN|nr:hypothetical protein XA68_17263 [Ophiocordyceps unilateralis]